MIEFLNPVFCGQNQFASGGLRLTPFGAASDAKRGGGPLCHTSSDGGEDKGYFAGHAGGRTFDSCHG
jgi:hypothetical protein